MKMEVRESYEIQNTAEARNEIMLETLTRSGSIVEAEKNVRGQLTFIRNYLCHHLNEFQPDVA